MNQIRERAQQQFPAVLLTLISIIQALALELMWSTIVTNEFLLQFNMKSLVAWGMLSVTLMGILLIWVLYTTLVMGFVWQPSLRDSLLPFIIGIQEFMLLSLIGPEFHSVWLYVLASLFVTVNWIVHISLRRARKHPANSQYFSKISPAKLRDFLPTFIIILIAVSLGLAVDFSGSTIWLPLLGIAYANCILISQIVITRRLWWSLMADIPETADINGHDSDGNREA